ALPPLQREVSREHLALAAGGLPPLQRAVSRDRLAVRLPGAALSPQAPQPPLHLGATSPRAAQVRVGVGMLPLDGSPHAVASPRVTVGGVVVVGPGARTPAGAVRATPAPHLQPPRSGGAAEAGSARARGRAEQRPASRRTAAKGPARAARAGWGLPRTGPDER
ncbi:unnamed protein product, partial [Prorocentrum cordatum]